MSQTLNFQFFYIWKHYWLRVPEIAKSYQNKHSILKQSYYEIHLVSLEWSTSFPGYLASAVEGRRKWRTEFQGVLKENWTLKSTLFYLKEYMYLK